MQSGPREIVTPFRPIPLDVPESMARNEFFNSTENLNDLMHNNGLLTNPENLLLYRKALGHSNEFDTSIIYNTSQVILDPLGRPVRRTQVPKPVKHVWNRMNQILIDYMQNSFPDPRTQLILCGEASLDATWPLTSPGVPSIRMLHNHFIVFPMQQLREARLADEARARRMKLKRPAGVTGEEWRALSAALAFSSESRPANAGEFARRFFGGDKGRASAEPRGPGTTGLLAAMALGGLLGYLLGILVPAHTWLPVRGGDEARLAPPSADPVSPQSDPAAESGAVPGGTEAEWVAPPTLATVEIQTGADRAAEAPETTAAEEAAPDDGAAGDAAAADPAPPVSPPVPAAVSARWSGPTGSGTPPTSCSGS